MIEDAEVKIAETHDESFWNNFKERCLKEIDNNKREIIINEKLVELANEKINEAKQNGK